MTIAAIIGQCPYCMRDDNPDVSSSALNGGLFGVNQLKKYLVKQIEHCKEYRDANIADGDLNEAAILNESVSIYKDILNKLEAI